VRDMSRSPRRGTTNVEWAQAQMLTGEGLSEALQGVDVIVHAATDTRLGKTDVGKMTWAQWLHRRYSQARQTGEKIGPVYKLRG
jgi:hypothetical protein